MKIVIVFFGITRSLSSTLPSIEKNIITPIRKFGNVSMLGHFFQQEAIDNPRSNENGLLDQNEYKLLNLDWTQLEKTDLCLDKWQFQRICKHGDAWNDDFKSLKNLIHQLHSLYCVTQEAIKYQPDIVLFCRPDLLYHDNFSPILNKAAHQTKKQNAYIPFWQWQTGLNDRFAICTGRKSIEAYGMRIEQIQNYFETFNEPLHSERLLKFALARQRIHVKPVRLRASRVRLGGEVKDESFSFLYHMGWKKVILDMLR